MSSDSNLLHPLRVLVLPSWYPTPSYPMGGIFIQEQARALAEEGTCQVSVLYIDRVSPGEFFRLGARSRLGKEDGLSVYRTAMPRVPVVWPLLYLLWAVLAARRLRKMGFRFDVVHAHVALPAGLGAALIKRLMRLPLVITEHTGPFSMLMRDPLARLATHFAIRSADRVITVSSALRDQILAYPALRCRIEVIPNVVNTADFFAPRPPRDSSSPPRLLFVGEMRTSIKGVDHLLGAISILRKRGIDVRLTLVGDGAQRRDYESLARSLGVDGLCMFLGNVPHEEVAHLMLESDLFVLSSLAETFGVVLVEALASGAPVVATRSGGPESIVTPDTGVLVAPADSRALADGMQVVLSRLEQFPPEHLRAVARERFGQHTFARRLVDLYPEVVPLYA